jgi:hypothetical protein
MKDMKKLNMGKMNSEKMVMAAGVSILLLALFQYSSTKSKQFNMQGYNSGNALYNSPKSLDDPAMVLQGNEQQTSQTLGNNASFASSEIPKAKVGTPTDLLPSDSNSEWGKLNPLGSGALENVGLLSAGKLSGINTVGNTLRNANLQIRAEPANPKMTVGPWQQSTIERDTQFQYGLKTDC